MLARFYPGMPSLYDMSPTEIRAYIGWMAEPEAEQGTDFDQDGDDRFWADLER